MSKSFSEAVKIVNVILKIDFRIVKNIDMDRLVFPKLLLEVFRCNISISHTSFVSVLVVFKAETGFSVLFEADIAKENCFVESTVVNCCLLSL